MEQPAMTVELWPVIATMLATALALAALIRNGQKAAREDARDNRAEIAALRKEMADRHRELGDRIAGLGDRVSGLGERVAGVAAELRLATDLLRDLLGRRNAAGTKPERAD